MFNKGLALVASLLALSACMPQQYNRNMPNPEISQVYNHLGQQKTQMEELSSRVNRVERAMIRLDNRMKLVERNELARFSNSQASNNVPMLNAQAGFKPTSFNTSNDIVNFAKINSPFAQRVNPTFTASPLRTGLVTSSLQVAPKPIAAPQLASANNVITSLPSLADTSASMQEKDVSIWTIEYSQNKIWPTRDQLVESKNVVDLLKGNAPVAVFARGANPSSKEFRERVRALSRYLGKVSNSQDVAIAAMPANHLDSDTIEVLVTK